MLTVSMNGLTDIGMHQTSMPIDDLKTALKLSQSGLRKNAEALERYGLGGVEEGLKGFEISIRHVYDVPFWYEVAQYCKAVGHHFRTHYLDLDFSGLDA